MIENKEIMASNLKRLMDEHHKTADEICKFLGVPASTFSYWVNAKAYPRIDKIEMLANFFGVTKSELVEEHSTMEQLDKEQKVLFSDFNALSEEDKKFVIGIIRGLKNGTIKG